MSSDISLLKIDSNKQEKISQGRKRYKRTTPKKKQPSEPMRPTRVRSRNRFDGKRQNHNRSKSSGDKPKNKEQLQPTDTSTIMEGKAKRGRKPVKKQNSR